MGLRPASMKARISMSRMEMTISMETFPAAMITPVTHPRAAFA